MSTLNPHPKVRAALLAMNPLDSVAAGRASTPAPTVEPACGFRQRRLRGEGAMRRSMRWKWELGNHENERRGCGGGGGGLTTGARHEGRGRDDVARLVDQPAIFVDERRPQLPCRGLWGLVFV